MEQIGMASVANLKRAVILMCASCDQPLPHTFMLARRAGEVGAFEEIYRCAKCGEERRFGLIA
jgi:RNase P subunit RPR2